MSLLEVRNLNAGYGRIQVLWDVSIDVEPNQVVALVGANGAGKTTLLRALTGMIRIRSGSIHFQGHEMAGSAIESIVDLGIAHVPEGRRLFMGLTVRENLLLGGWRKNNRDLTRVIELFPALGERLNQTASTMSGGEQQMCAIGRGLMSMPTLLLIDELSLGLAPKTVDEIVARLPQIAASGTAVLLVEQDIDIALSVSERAYVVETGRITRSGPSRELLTDRSIQEAYLGLSPG
ncbi:MAG: branched-chain amino acid ABC transporter ATP-binding protein [Actinobacteria bacterium 13_2_20CM_2_66_6]|nr:MAG: branched-chain amino acid ABC transporter ATP-binding protein [Actinobacteria bacterium 13_2_20CM_2_66_6]